MRVNFSHYNVSSWPQFGLALSLIVGEQESYAIQARQIFSKAGHGKNRSSWRVSERRQWFMISSERPEPRWCFQWWGLTSIFSENTATWKGVKGEPTTTISQAMTVSSMAGFPFRHVTLFSLDPSSSWIVALPLILVKCFQRDYSWPHCIQSTSHPCPCVSLSWLSAHAHFSFSQGGECHLISHPSDYIIRVLANLISSHLITLIWLLHDCVISSSHYTSNHTLSCLALY